MEPTIKLDQFLKLADVVRSGGEAKHLIQSGQVVVNGKVETRRGRKLRAGDVVRVEEEDLVVDVQELEQNEAEPYGGSDGAGDFEAYGDRSKRNERRRGRERSE